MRLESWVHLRERIVLASPGTRNAVVGAAAGPVSCPPAGGTPPEGGRMAKRETRATERRGRWRDL
ncbi:MAG: hypothetical protein JXP34_25915, partial [Planctomycetes bacterium]|nr:hypothetical protein [Planctomycetota bacterium]